MANSVTADGVLNALFDYAAVRSQIDQVKLASSRGSNVSLFDELCQRETHLLSLTKQYQESLRRAEARAKQKQKQKENNHE